MSIYARGYERTYGWQSPSNIALVKYWGKKGFQLPSNASISFTLSKCVTESYLTLRSKANSDQQIEVFVDGTRNTSFEPKVKVFLRRIEERYPDLKHFDFHLSTSNSFPHSSGIASSASGMSALSLCICSWLEEEDLLEGDFFQTASYLARIGSGSASRSVYESMAVWGEHNDYPGSSDEYAVVFDQFDDVFQDYQDTILLVHEGQKSVSSTVGHKLLDNHPFGATRFELADKHMSEIRDILMDGDLNKFVEMVENEALMLHALMMTSDPSFILMMPNTLAVIEKIREFRKQKNIPIAFTLDAGANVHVLYPKRYEAECMDLIEKDLVSYCEDGKYICDQVGGGPKPL